MADKVILVSGSPRRRELISEITRNFVVWAGSQDEPEWSQNEAPGSYLNRALRHKWSDACTRWRELGKPQALILVADTIVVQDSTVLGKPKDSHHAVQTLKRLSGTWHEVWTGFALARGSEPSPSFERVVSKIRFRSIPRPEIESYVRTGEPMDKAGAYGFQGPALSFVSELRGSYSNVVGLPVLEVAERLRAQR